MRSFVRLSRGTRWAGRVAWLAGVVFTLAGAPSLAAAPPSLAAQGDAALGRADYRAAVRIYTRALAAAQEPAVREDLARRLGRATLLEKTDDFLSLLDREAQKKGDIRISVKQLLALMVAGEKVTLVDIRTPQERLFAVPGRGIAIPLPELGRSLARLPTDGVVVLVCHSGPRAVIGASALRILGRDNVFALNGGIMALADINAKKAPESLP